MLWDLVVLLVFISLLAVAGGIWWRDRAYVKKKTSETMSERVWEDILKEREDALKKRRLFRETLERAKKE